MTIPDGESHDALVALLWELKTAWQAKTGNEVLLTSLLLERAQLDRFLAEAAQVDDVDLRAIVARIVALQVSVGMEPSSTPTALGTSDSPPQGSKATTATAGWTGFDRFRSTAVIVASLLVSAAAGRYLLGAETRPMSASTVSIAQPATQPTAQSPAPPAERRVGEAVAGSGAASTAASVPGPAAPPLPPSEAGNDLILRIHGSNTVGEKLSPALVEGFLRSRGASAIVTLPGSAPVAKTMVATIAGRPRPVGVEIHAHGSSTAFSDLSSGTADLGQSSRRIKPEEVASLAEKHGDLSKPGSEHVVALDGLAVIVHPQNPVTSLSIDQIAKVFAGKIRNWSELGGSPTPIVLYARDDVSGTWDTFKHLVLAPAGLELEASARRFESSGELSDSVARDTGGIGFIGLPYVRGSKALSVSAQTGGFALVPTAFTVGTEDYPLSRRLYFYSPAGSTNETMREFVDFALSDPGQEIVRQVGFVSQNVALERPRIDAAVPSEYRQATNDGERLSLNFRFESNSENLDGKALRDLERVVAFLDRDRSREIVLFGFTDDRGDDRANAVLSRKRAEVVARALEARGVHSQQVHGFGEALPVASNATDEGRNRNRRVEVWVR